MTTERARERRNLQEIIEALERRLEVREVQTAQLGPNTPPEIRTEIEDIQVQLRALRPGARTRVDPEIVQEIGPLGQYQLLLAHIQQLHGDVYNNRKFIGDIATRLTSEINSVETQMTAQIVRLQERFDRALLVLTCGIILGFVILAIVR